MRVRRGGAIALPARVRERYNIKDGDTVYLVDLDGVMLLAPRRLLVPQLAREIEEARIEAGLEMNELLAGLREQRERYYEEHYGPSAQ